MLKNYKNDLIAIGVIFGLIAYSINIAIAAPEPAPQKDVVLATRGHEAEVPKQAQPAPIKKAVKPTKANKEVKPVEPKKDPNRKKPTLKKKYANKK